MAAVRTSLWPSPSTSATNSSSCSRRRSSRSSGVPRRHCRISRCQSQSSRRPHGRAASGPAAMPRSSCSPALKTRVSRSAQMNSLAQPKLIAWESGLASRLARGSQQIHCQNTPRPQRSVTNGVRWRASRWPLRMRVIRSCGSSRPTRIPCAKSIHSLRNASPEGGSAGRGRRGPAGNRGVFMAAAANSPCPPGRRARVRGRGRVRCGRGCRPRGAAGRRRGPGR